MHYIASLAKFGNCCSLVWVRRQGQWKGKNFSLSFSEEAAKTLRVVLQCIFGRDFLITTYYKSLRQWRSYVGTAWAHSVRA